MREVGINTLTETWDFRTNPTPERIYFNCPHCGHTNEQNPQNFNYWCEGCGKNAMDE